MASTKFDGLAPLSFLLAYLCMLHYESATEIAVFEQTLPTILP